MATLDELTRSYRKQTLNLRAATLRDLQRLWPALDIRRVDDTFPTWLVAAVAVIRRDRTRAAGLASAYLRAYWLGSGVPGEAVVKLAQPASLEQLETSLRVTAKIAVKKGAAAGYSPEKVAQNAFVQTSGAATRHVLDGGRDTIRDSLTADPQGTGWQRITSGGCPFCRMLADRGAVYAPDTADFGAHDHCACSAQPVYGGDPRKVKSYVPSQRQASDADKARLRAYLRAHHPRT